MSAASPVQLYAVLPEGPQPLAVPPDVPDLMDLYEGLPVGIYEGMRTFGGSRLLRLEAHFDRADRSLASVGFDVRLDRDAMRLALKRACELWSEGDARLRFDVLPEPATSLGTESRTLLAFAPLPRLPADAFTHGVAIGVAGDLQRQMPRVKQAQWIRERRATASPTDDVIDYALLDEERRVLEGTTSNLFFVRGGRLLTAYTGVLEGVTRGIVLELAGTCGIHTALEATPIDEVPACEEAILTSASRGPVPLTRVGGASVGDGRPGPVWKAIREAYEALVEREARPPLP